MKILALEFSSPERSAAVIESETHTVAGYAAARQSESVPALNLVDNALKQAGLERESVDCLAVGLGPGSYTGIRAAIAMAQGWQLARNIRLLGIGSMECLATRVAATGWTGRLHVTVDAQRGELYLAAYEIDPAGCHLLAPLSIVKPAALAAMPKARTIGPEASRWAADGETAYPCAQTLGLLAAARTDFLPGEKLEPIYLREANFVKAPPPRTLPPLPGA